MRSAKAWLTPSTFRRSATSARLTPRAEPKACRSARLRAGPTPSISSSGFLVSALARLARWVPIAKRWAASRRRWR